MPELNPNELETALGRYVGLQTKLDELLGKIETALAGQTHWWICAPMVARKFLKQARSLELLFRSEWTEYHGRGERTIVDVASYYVLLRAMYEAYAVFCHLFKPCDDPGENILRFHLWQIDGLQNRLNFTREHISEEVQAELDEDRKQIASLKEHLAKFRFFQVLESEKQQFLVNKHAWKFSTDSLKRDRRKWQHSITELIQRTGIKQHVLNDLYSYYSMHAHTGYVSILQNDDLPETDKQVMKWVAIMNGSYVTAFMLQDLASRFAEGKPFLESLTQQEKYTIASFVKAKE